MGNNADSDGAFSSKVDTGLRRENATRQRDGAFSSKVDTGLRRENATRQRDGAFSSKVDTGLCCENATRQRDGAFSSKVDTGLRRENATRQRDGAFSSKVDTGLRRENATRQRDGAFSSKVDTGLRRENATRQRDGAFSSKVDTGLRRENATEQRDRAFSSKWTPVCVAENATRQRDGAFSSKVDTGLRRENATKQRDRAFSSKVDTGLRRENATKQRDSASAPIQSERKKALGVRAANPSPVPASPIAAIACGCSQRRIEEHIRIGLGQEIRDHAYGEAILEQRGVALGMDGDRGQLGGCAAIFATVAGAEQVGVLATQRQNRDRPAALRIAATWSGFSARCRFPTAPRQDGYRRPERAARSPRRKIAVRLPHSSSDRLVKKRLSSNGPIRSLHPNCPAAVPCRHSP